MTNFETALQSYVDHEITICLRVGANPGDHEGAHEGTMDLKVLEVMSDSFVGAWADRTVYVPFHAIAYFIAPND